MADNPGSGNSAQQPPQPGAISPATQGVARFSIQTQATAIQIAFGQNSMPFDPSGAVAANPAIEWLTPYR
ncbi:MAG: hypothetical protein WDN29_06670 [Methylovirgula sp.]